jgi:hypothetical protein
MADVCPHGGFEDFKSEMTRSKNKTVPENLRRHAAHLHLLAKSKKPLRKAILKASDGKLIRAICECCKNALHGDVQHPPTRKRRLRQHKRWIKEILNKKTGIKRKRDILIHNGGFLPILLNALGGLLPTLFGSIFGKQ